MSADQQDPQTIHAHYIQQRLEAEELVARAFNGPYPPILIYQMGKVGSTAIDVALIHANLPYSVFKPHTLTESLERTYRDLINRRAPVPPYLAVDLALKRALDSGQVPPKIYVITLVRDPVARTISAFFENPQATRAPVFDAYGNLHTSAVICHLRELSAETILQRSFEWFNRELAKRFHIDVFRLPFDRTTGWSLYRGQRIDLLVMQTEAILPQGHKALAALFHTPKPIPIPKARTRETMPFAETYAEVKRELRLPTDICDAIYSDPRTRHFYTDEQIVAFRRRWEEGANPDERAPA